MKSVWYFLLLQADIDSLKKAICSAVDVMQAMASSICSLLPRVRFVVIYGYIFVYRQFFRLQVFCNKEYYPIIGGFVSSNHVECIRYVYFILFYFLLLPPFNFLISFCSGWHAVLT